MKQLFKNPIFLVLLILIAANVAMFWKFYFKGLLPFPGDLLVSYYFPWSSGGFIGFDPWTTRKGVIAMDAIRQMLPWKSLILSQLHAGQWPLWNPFNFSGSPLLANLQSSVFFPGNFVFSLLPKLWAYISLVIGLPLVFSLFSYLFLKSLKINTWAAVFGAIAIANIGYFTMWAEQLIVIQSTIFLPLILFLINLYVEKKKPYLIWLTAPLLGFSLFGGHPQTVLYVYLIVFFYAIYKKIPLLKIFLIFVLGIGISGIQLLPSLELYLYSARTNELQRQFIATTALPWKNLATIFAPDYFGSPATFNFRGLNYDNFQVYFGVVAFLLALIGAKRNRFFLALAIFGLLFALPPLAYIGFNLSIPIIASGFLSRIVFIFGFAMCVLAAYGMDSLFKKEVPVKLPIIFTSVCFGLLTTAALFFNSGERIISLKSLVVTGAVFVVASVVILLRHKSKYFFFAIIGAAILEYAYFFNRYEPFAPKKFVFPDHPVFEFLQSNAGVNRYFGIDRAYVDSNFATYYQVFSPEGYDPLYIQDYGTMLAFPNSPAPSDAVVQKTDTQDQKKLFNLLGVKYFIDKTDDPQTDYGPNNDRFPPQDYQFIKQINKWKFYENKNALPHAFLSGSYMITNHHDAIEAFYNPRIDLKTIILEQKPAIEPFNDKKGEANIISYTPNKVLVNTSSPSPKLLFLSDDFYPGWQVTVDGQKAPLLRADYTFRAVALERGDHQVVFSYQPQSFEYGALISVISLIILAGLLLVSKRHA